MSSVRVKFDVSHLREDIAAYLETEGATRAEVVAAAVSDALASFDFEGAVAKVAHAEIQRFVEQAARTYFKGILESREAHSVVIETLQAQIGMTQ